jgi:glutamate synthase domain-containing protein 3
MGITDTAMLRPQVFAFCDGEVQVGLICSEKQAIDATLMSLNREDSRICPVADRYWNARGGSYTDGGAFIFNLEKNPSGKMRMTCTDKFGLPVPMPSGTRVCDLSKPAVANNEINNPIEKYFALGQIDDLYRYITGNLPAWSFDDFRSAVNKIVEIAGDHRHTRSAIELLTVLNDRRYSTGDKKRNYIIHIIREGWKQLFGNIPAISSTHNESEYRLIDYRSRDLLRKPEQGETTLVIDSREFPAEGDNSAAALLMDGYIRGWRHFISYNCIGQRFFGCGLGPQTEGVSIDVYDSSGDYLGSGIDGLTISVHGNTQDQLGQIIKTGKLVIYGDVGQTFMYGAKGGSIYLMGNAAGRPLINSVGKPRVVINGTCLDFLAESFMAGDVLNGGGFVVLNGVTFDDNGRVTPLREPYSGGNLFSLASGGAIYIRDPKQQLIMEQLNGGEFASLTDEDWELILPYLQENERLFGIRIEDLLMVDGRQCRPEEVYRKVIPVKNAALAATGAAAKQAAAQFDKRAGGVDDDDDDDE